MIEDGSISEGGVRARVEGHRGIHGRKRPSEGWMSRCEEVGKESGRPDRWLIRRSSVDRRGKGREQVSGTIHSLTWSEGVVLSYWPMNGNSRERSVASMGINSGSRSRVWKFSRIDARGTKRRDQHDDRVETASTDERRV